MDDCDLGNRYAEFFRLQALARARTKPHAGESRTECIDCGEEIPEARRKAVPGCVRCVQCETKAEKTY